MVDIANNLKLAVLIDADNATATVCENLLKEVALYGTAHIKRIYGDWTTPNLKSWKAQLHKHAIQPVQQFSYTSGKNATDSSLIIDAMDLLHQNHLNGFCLVSSDSDFTRLATRIRESGLMVYGFGEKKTPEPFISACDKFIYFENLSGSTETSVPDKAAAKTAKTKLNENAKLKSILTDAITYLTNDYEWAYLAGVGAYISKNNPAFDARSYGYKKLGLLIRDLDYIELNEKTDNNITVVSVRLKS